MPSFDGDPPGPAPRRRATTLLGWCLVLFGVLGLGRSLWGLASVLAIPPESAPGRSALLADSILQTLGKLGLLVAAAALLARSRSAPAAFWAALGLSAAGTVHTAVFILPGRAAALEGAASVGYYLGAYAACFVSLLVYAALILYLRTGAARREFGL